MSGCMTSSKRSLRPVSSKKVYNPQISLRSYEILKRLSWFNSLPMTKTLDMVIEEVLQLYNKEIICDCCKEKDCNNCPIRKS